MGGDPTYLVVTDGGAIETWGINSICTHLGCVVPWNAAENKFKCPCHGSQYDFTGMKIRGPAPLSLALAHAEVTAATRSSSPPGRRRTSGPARSPGGSRKRAQPAESPVSVTRTWIERHVCEK